MKSKAAPKDNLRTTILLGVCALAVLYMVVVKPKKTEVAKANEALATATMALESAKVELNSLGPQPDDAELARLIVQVPRTADTPAFFNQISEIAQANAVSIGDLSFSPPSKAAGGLGSEVKVTLAASGQRTAIDQFMTAITNLPRLAVIDQANLTPEAAEGQAASDTSGHVTVDLSITLFSGLTASS